MGQCIKEYCNQFDPPCGCREDCERYGMDPECYDEHLEKKSRDVE